MNSDFKLIKTTLEGAYLISCFRREDERGNFTKFFLSSFFTDNLLQDNVSEVFYAYNTKLNTIRGMHFALKYPQTKLVTCPVGEIYDVIIDLRKNSKTFLKYEGFVLSQENGLSLYVPSGFAHGYLVIKPGVVIYNVCGKYYPEYDSGIRYDDKQFNIKWPFVNEDVKSLIISQKDASLLTYDEIKNKIEY